MRITLRHAGRIRCDAPLCEHSFFSGSLVSLIRTQAKHEGWMRVAGWQIDGGGLSHRRKYDVRPVHAVFAKAAKDKRDDERAAKRKAKVERMKMPAQVAT